MNIAFFVTGIDQIGGTEIATTRLAGRIAQHGHEVTIISTQSITQWRKHRRIIDYTKRFRLIRLPIWQRSRITFARILVAHALWAFPALLRNTQIIHLRGLTPETISLAHIAHRLGIKTLCVPMASGSYGDVMQFPAGKTHSPKAFDYMSALTQPLKEELVSWGFPTDRIEVIPNGVDTNMFNQPDHIQTTPNIIFVGQFRPEKRIDLLLSAWTLIQHQHPKAKLTLVGGGQYLPKYQEIAEELGIHVQFIPNIDGPSVLSYLQSNNIFVLPGISEGMSNALLEAMAVGLAPIVTDTPANRAVITPEFDGLCYRSDSAEDLADKIHLLITNAKLRERLGKEARRTTERYFTFEHVIDQYLALYQRMLGGNL